MTMLRGIIAVLLLWVWVPATAKDTWKNVDRVIAIGDIHGDYEQYRQVMQMAGVLDETGKWAAGKTHLVQLGDIPDRGPDSLRIMRELVALQKPARRAGGFVHLLIGNHEAMNIHGDLRYVHSGEYAVLVDQESAARRDDYFGQVLAHLPQEVTAAEGFRAQWYHTHPLGYVEHRVLWQPGGELARIVAGHNTIIRINRSLFVHGGINPHGDYLSLQRINRQVRKEMQTMTPDDNALAIAEDGPLWYRGLAMRNDPVEAEALTRMLDYYQADRIVIGHTPTRGYINPRFDGRVLAADVGISSHYGGGVAALLIDAGKPIAIHRGEPVPLPTDDNKVREYLGRIAALEPNPAAINQAIEQLSQTP